MQQIIRTLRPEARHAFRGQFAHSVANIGASSDREREQQQQQTQSQLPLALTLGAGSFATPVVRRDVSATSSVCVWSPPVNRWSSNDGAAATWTVWSPVLVEGSTQQLEAWDGASNAVVPASPKKNRGKVLKDGKQRRRVDLAAEHVLESFVFPDVDKIETEPETLSTEIQKGSSVVNESAEVDSELSLAAISELTDDQAKTMILWLTEGDAEERSYAMGQITGLLWPLCVSQHGSRVVQKAFEVADPEEQILLADQLKGRVREASKSPHANYVLQKCIELLPPERVEFVVDELSGRSVVTARHRFGCRILQRLIEHCPSRQTSDLVVEVMTDADRLCRHPFGNFVLQHILEHGTNVQQSQVVDVLVPDSSGLARHRIASHVLQRALVHSSPRDRERLSASLVSSPDEMRSLAHSQYGSFVMREISGKR